MASTTTACSRAPSGQQSSAMVFRLLLLILVGGAVGVYSGTGEPPVPCGRRGLIGGPCGVLRFFGGHQGIVAPLALGAAGGGAHRTTPIARSTVRTILRSRSLLADRKSTRLKSSHCQNSYCGFF